MSRRPWPLSSRSFLSHSWLRHIPLCSLATDRIVQFCTKMFLTLGQTVCACMKCHVGTYIEFVDVSRYDSASHERQDDTVLIMFVVIIVIAGVGIVGLEDLGSGVRVPVTSRIFFYFPFLSDWLWEPPNLPSNVYHCVVSSPCVLSIWRKDHSFGLPYKSSHRCVISSACILSFWNKEHSFGTSCTVILTAVPYPQHVFSAPEIRNIVLVHPVQSSSPFCHILSMLRQALK
jgi:hypothetical protein